MSATFVARLWLPDIPGTLGHVAAAIGRAEGDVIGIEILERGAGMAIDELLIEIPDAEGVDALILELSSVDGVSVEDVHQVDRERQDQSVLALEVAARIAETPRDQRLEAACRLTRSMLEAQWCTAVIRDMKPIEVGHVPDVEWLKAFLEGISHLDETSALEHTPGDVVWAGLVRSEGFLVCGRIDRPFRSRERQHLSLIARIVDSLLIGDPILRTFDGA